MKKPWGKRGGDGFSCPLFCKLGAGGSSLFRRGEAFCIRNFATGCDSLNPRPDGAIFREGHLSIVKETCRLFGFEAENVLTLLQTCRLT